MEVRFGIVGLGAISTRFAGVLKTVEGVKLTSVASREQTRSEVFAHKFGAKRAYHNYLDVISDDEVDIVYIGLTHNFHYEITKACLERHKAVLCEKPLATTYHDASELVALARKNRDFLMEGLWTRCMPAFRKAREWVRTGRIGEVRLITSNFCFKARYDPESRLFNPRLAGGSLFDVGIYPINLAIGILGEYPESINGQARIAPSGVDESAAIAMRFASGTLASLNCGFNVDAAPEAVIYGTLGRIKLNNCYGPTRCELYDERGHRLERFKDPVRDGFEHEIRHCAELYRQGKLESDLIPWNDTLATAGIFDTLRKQWGLI
jgi:predicted dehydrogenase